MTHGLPIWFEATSLVFMGALLLSDLLIVIHRPHVPPVRESALWVAFYVTLAVAFGGILFAVGGSAPATEFYAGWLTEYSLSVDNLFVFVIIMTRFAVPRQFQQRVLMVGIILALVLRGGFIAAGAAVVERFVWVFYFFGAFLLYTAITLLRGEDDDKEQFKENALIRVTRRVLPLHPHYDGAKVRTTVDGRRLFTPMLVVFVAIGSTDLLFAFDSIPAIFGLTKDPFIVFATNLFALMGLRQLYFLLGGLLERLVYLKYALAVILGFIGIKLVFEAMSGNTLPFVNGGEGIGWVPHFPIWVSLLVIVASLALATVGSLLRTRRTRDDPSSSSVTPT
jgi:tellurite resistance protein TerC